MMRSQLQFSMHIQFGRVASQAPHGPANMTRKIPDAVVVCGYDRQALVGK